MTADSCCCNTFSFFVSKIHMMSWLPLLFFFYRKMLYTFSRFFHFFSFLLWWWFSRLLLELLSLLLFDSHDITDDQHHHLVLEVKGREINTSQEKKSDDEGERSKREVSQEVPKVVKGRKEITQFCSVYSSWSWGPFLMILLPPWLPVSVSFSWGGRSVWFLWDKEWRRERRMNEGEEGSQEREEKDPL